MRLPLLILPVALLLAGCGKGFSERASAGKEDTFRYPIITNPTSMDPAVVQDGDTLDLIQQVYEGLVTWGEDNQVHGLLAESWTIEDGGTLFRFKIKEGVLFHNGTELTAEDIKWTYERNTDPAFPSTTAAAYLSDIVGVEEKIAGNADEISGIQVVGPHELTIRIKQPTPYFLGKLTYLVSAALPSGDVPTDEEIGQIENMIGTGPFKLMTYEPNQVVVLERFEDYHGGPAEIKYIERPVILDELTRLNEYKNHQLDMVMLQRQQVQGLKGTEYESQLKFYQRPAVWYVGMNQKVVPAFKDRRVRRAVAMAIDKDHIVNVIMGGHNMVANSIVPEGVPGGNRPDAAAIEFNPQRARELLAEAGYPDGEGFPELEIFIRDKFLDYRIVAEAVASQLKENLGIDVRIATREWASYLDLYNQSELPFYHMRWAADYLDPQNFLSHMLATWGPENKSGYSNPEFDALCKRADSMMDMEQRLELYAKAEDIALQDAVWVPIYFQRDAELQRPNVHGMRESLFGHLPNTEVYKE